MDANSPLQVEEPLIKQEIDYILPDTDNEIYMTQDEETPNRERKVKRRACQVIKKHVDDSVEGTKATKASGKRGQKNSKDHRDDVWKDELVEESSDSDYEDRHRSAKVRKRSNSNRKSFTAGQKKERAERVKAKRKPLSEEQKQRLKEKRKPLSAEKKRIMAERVRAKRAAMTPEQQEEFRRKSREGTAARRRKQEEQKKKLLQSAIERDDKDAGKLFEQVEHEKFESKMKRFLYHHACRAQMSEEDKAKFRRERYLKTIAKRANETAEEREERKSKNRMIYLNRRVNMTLEQLAHFRKMGREHQYKVKQKWLPYSQWSEKRKEYHREYMKEKIKRETPEQRQLRLERDKRCQLKKRQIKSLMNSGASKEEAEKILKQKRPELFPPPASRGRTRRIKDDEVREPYTPRQDGRGNRNAKPPEVSQEELQEYLADPEKWKRNFRSKWNYPAKTSDNSANLKTVVVETLQDTDVSQDSNFSNHNSICPGEGITTEQNSSAVEAKSLPETVWNQNQHNLASTSPVSFPSEETPTSAQRSPFKTIKLGDISDTDDLDNDTSYINVSAFSPEHPPSASPVSAINVEIAVPDLRQNHESLSVKINHEIIAEGDNTAASVTSSKTENIEIKTDQPSVTPKIKRKQIRNTEYCCELCGKVYKCKRYYQAHVAEIHGKSNSKLFTCPMKECGMTFVSSIACRIHYRHHIDYSTSTSEQQKKKQKPMPICRICHVAFDKLCDLQKHTRLAHSVDYRTAIECEMKHRCGYCNKEFKQKATLDDHVRRIHLGMSDNCDKCGRNFQSAVKLWRHKVNAHRMKDLHPSEVGIQVEICPYCPEYVFRSMKAHVQKQHPDYLKDHMSSENEDVKKINSKGHYCELCNKTLSKNVTPEVHMRGKHPELLVGKDDARPSCEVCGKKVWTEKSLATHILHAHVKRIQFKLDSNIKENGENEPLGCQFCSVEQDDRTMYKIHLINDHSEDLIRLVKSKVEEGKVLDNKDLDRIRGRLWREKNPWAKRYPRKTPKKQAPKVAQKCRRNVRSKVLIKNCGQKATAQSMSEEDRIFLERYPNIKWGCPVVVIKLLSASEISLLTKRIKQEVDTDV